MTTSVHLNGEPRVLQHRELTRLLSELNLPKRFAVSINTEVIPKSKWTEVTLSSGDQIEVVVAVGGG